MTSLKPPARCPCCGTRPAELSKHWSEVLLPTRKTIRFPVAISAVYHCGARIESQYISNLGISGLANGAYWQLFALDGCRETLAHELVLRGRHRVRVKTMARGAPR